MKNMQRGGVRHTASDTRTPKTMEIGNQPTGRRFIQAAQTHTKRGAKLSYQTYGLFSTFSLKGSTYFKL